MTINTFDPTEETIQEAVSLAKGKQYKAALRMISGLSSPRADQLRKKLIPLAEKEPVKGLNTRRIIMALAAVAAVLMVIAVSTIGKPRLTSASDSASAPVSAPVIDLRAASSSQYEKNEETCRLINNTTDFVNCSAKNVEFKVCSNNVNGWSEYNGCTLQFMLEFCAINWKGDTSKITACEKRAKASAPSNIVMP